MAQDTMFTQVTLKFDGGADVAAFCERAEFSPSHHVVRGRTFSGVKAGAGNPEWTLELEGFQDFLETASVANYLAAHHGETIQAVVVWTENDGNGTVTGTADVVALATGFGGTVDEMQKFAVSLPLQGNPTIVPVPTP